MCFCACVCVPSSSSFPRFAAGIFHGLSLLPLDVNVGVSVGTAGGAAAPPNCCWKSATSSGSRAQRRTPPSLVVSLPAIWTRVARRKQRARPQLRDLSRAPLAANPKVRQRLARFWTEYLALVRAHTAQILGDASHFARVIGRINTSHYVVGSRST